MSITISASSPGPVTLMCAKCCHACCKCGPDHDGNTCCYSNDSVITIQWPTMDDTSPLRNSGDPGWSGYFTSTLSTKSFTCHFVTCNNSDCPCGESGTCGPIWESDPFGAFTDTHGIQWRQLIRFTSTCCIDDEFDEVDLPGVVLNNIMEYFDPDTGTWLESPISWGGDEGIIQPVIQTTGCGSGYVVFGANCSSWNWLSPWCPDVDGGSFDYTLENEDCTLVGYPGPVNAVVGGVNTFCSDTPTALNETSWTISNNCCSEDGDCQKGSPESNGACTEMKREGAAVKAEAWGPRLWRELHTYPRTFTTAIDEQKRLSRFEKRIHCSECLNHWLALKVKTPPALESAKAYFEWGYRMHEGVNALRKVKGITLAECYALWWPEKDHEKAGSNT